MIKLWGWSHNRKVTRVTYFLMLSFQAMKFNTIHACHSGSFSIYFTPAKIFKYTLLAGTKVHADSFLREDLNFGL